MTLLHQPDNRRLIVLLEAWAQHHSKETYAAVKAELLEGNSFLMLPSGNSPDTVSGWHRSPKSTRLQLASIYTIEGKKALGAFTDADSVLRWSNGKLTPCVSLESKAVLRLCETMGFERSLSIAAPPMFIPYPTS